MKKIVISILCLMLVLSFAGCKKEAEAETVSVANPWSDWETLAEAEEAAGYSFGAAETIGEAYTAVAFRTMSGDNATLEVVFENGDSKVTVRKVAGEGEDVSGVYDCNNVETEDWNESVSVAYASSDEGAMKVTFSYDGYSWSLYAPAGFPDGVCESFLKAILG